MASSFLTRGDIDAFVAVFSNNLATALTGTGMILAIVGPEVIYKSVWPGIGIAMFFGCIFYALQCYFESKRQGRSDMCAQPFGINTPGVFAFNLAIIFPIYAAGGATPEAGLKAWRVAVAANLLQGIIEIVLSVVGPKLAEAVPLVALLGSLASIGMAFLFTNTFQAQLALPHVGVVCAFVFFMVMYGAISFKRFPVTLIPVCIGTVIAWSFGVMAWKGENGLANSIENVGWNPAKLHFEIFDNFEDTVPYLVVAVPVGLTVSVATVQCRMLALKAGDEYSLRTSMLGDGLATVIAALFGCPYGMTVFIGHPTFKEMGAKFGHNVLCGFAMIAVCFSGVTAPLLRLVPVESLNPIILFVGLAICDDALDVTEKRHWPAFIISLVPGIANWAVAQCQAYADKVCAVSGANCQAGLHGMTAWKESHELKGLYILGQGNLFTSILYASVIVYAIDRQFGKAAVVMLVSSLCSLFGLIHSDVVFLPWNHPEDHPENLHLFLAVSYAILSAVFGVAVLFQSGGFVGAAFVEKHRRADLEEGSNQVFGREVQADEAKVDS